MVQDVATRWIQAYPCQSKKISPDGKEFTKVSRAVRKAESYFFRQVFEIWQILWRIIMESFHMNATLIRDKCHCCKSSAPELGKGHLQYCCNLARTKSGGLTLWNAVAICKMFKTSWQTGKTPFERRLGEPLKGPVVPFSAMVECRPTSAHDQSKLHQFGTQIDQEYSQYAEEPHLIKNGRKINCNTANNVTIRCSQFIDKFFYFISTCFFNMFIAGYCDQHGKSSNKKVRVWVKGHRGNLSHGSAETENPNKNDDDEELLSDQLQGGPDWLQEFKHGSMDG